jgi:hypothetical protein
MRKQIYVSLLSGDYSNLNQYIEKGNESSVYLTIKRYEKEDSSFFNTKEQNAIGMSKFIHEASEEQIF